MKLIKAVSVLSTVAFLAACAQQEEVVVPVTPEPTYDKYGNVVS